MTHAMDDPVTSHAGTDPAPSTASAAPVSAAPASASAAAPLHRQRMLEVTDTCLRQFGYDGATIRRIAARLGCAVGSIYRFFPDKRALMHAVTQQCFEPVAERVEAGEPVAATARHYLQAAAEAPHHYRLMFWLSAPGPHGEPTLPGVIGRILEGWATQLGDAAARRFWSQLHGSLMLGRDGDETLRTLLDEIKSSNAHAGASNGAADTSRQGWHRDTDDDVTLL